MRSLHDLGEKAVVSGLLAQIGASGDIGIGDDAAAVKIGSRYLVVSTDLISRRTHMPKGMTPRQIGWMAAAVNLSDIAAMGASPLGLVMAMGLPRETELEFLQEIIGGVIDCVESNSTQYLGGDTKECPELTIAGTSLGLVRHDGILLRSGAKAGDLLAVTGSVGLAGAAYFDLENPEADMTVRRAMLEPRPRLKEGTILSASGVVTACMDTSDGIASSLYELGKASSVGFLVRYGDLPIPDSVRGICGRVGRPVEDAALFSGGDYQLLFTIRPDGLERLRAMLGQDFTVIGKVTAGTDIEMIRDGRTEDLPNKGYEHFKS
ncbi:MAG TPA: thiamine-phosphate kinase [Methanomassiliicoccales archaeon]|nr:thiamine-phosphate kinase [Methanomassiliicoccales archaeon]